MTHRDHDAGPVTCGHKDRHFIAQGNVGIEHLVVIRGAKIIGGAIVKADHRGADIGLEQSVERIKQIGEAEIGADGAAGRLGVEIGIKLPGRAVLRKDRNEHAVMVENRAAKLGQGGGETFGADSRHRARNGWQRVNT